MRLSQDIANLLAVAIRDVIWFQSSVLSFLEGCGVPRPIMIDLNRMRKAKKPTVLMIHHVLDALDVRGPEGYEIARRMLTKMHYWNDLHTVPADRKDAAVASLKALQAAVVRFRAQEEYKKEQESREQATHKVRESRGRLKNLDHRALAGFRDEFDRIYAIAVPQERGNRFQDLMNRIFNYYCEESKGDFRRIGEQIDGQFYFDKHWYFVEVRWKQEQTQAADISVLRDRARSAFGGDTKALFLSFNGFTPECLASLAGRTDERVVLMDGYDLRCVLDGQIGFDVLLAEKQAELVRNTRPFVGAQEIITNRAKAPPQP